MSRPVPLQVMWNPEVGAFLPHNRHLPYCRREFAAGEIITFVRHEERSDASHRHLFAAIKTAWDSLPEGVAERFPTPEHLRKRALIKAGYYHDREMVCDSSEQAAVIAAFIVPMDEYAVVIVRENVVRILTAKSQSVQAMGKEDFQASKQAVMEIVAELIGTTAKQLASQKEAS